MSKLTPDDKKFVVVGTFFAAFGTLAVYLIVSEMLGWSAWWLAEYILDILNQIMG